MRIGFYGATGSNDFGDYAMMIHNIQYIWQLMPSIEFDIYTPNKYNTLKNLYDNLLEKEKLKQIRIVDEPSLLNNGKITLINQVVKKTSGREFILFRKFEKLRKGKIETINPEFRMSIHSVDILLFNGGGFIQHTWGGKNISFLAAIVAAKYYNKPVYFLGCSLGPMGIYDKYLSETISLVDKILIRDGKEYTLDRVKKYGYKNYVEGSDDLLFVSDYYKLEKEYDNYIVIEIMNWVNKAKRGLDYVLQELSKFVDYVIENEHKNVVLICFDNDDKIAISYIKTVYKLSKYPKNVFCEIEIGNIYDVFAIYKYCDYSISFKYHPVILALGCQKPCLGIICDNDGYYEGKMNGAFDSCGLERNALYLDELSFELLLEKFKSNITAIITSEKKKELLQIKKEFICGILNITEE